jgi:cell division protein FtsQ
MPFPAHSPRVYRQRRQRLRRLIFFLLIVTALFYFIHSGFFGLGEIKITGNEYIPAAELEDLMGIARGVNLWQVDTTMVAGRLATHPLVAAARVSRRWPRTLVVQVQARKPAALLVQDGGFLLVDGDGVVMERISSLGDLKLPLISGPGSPGDAGPGKEIAHPGLKAALAVCRQIPPGELSRLQEIIAPAADKLDLIWEGNIRVRFGDSQQVAAKLARLQEALQGLAGGETIDYIDVSFAGAPVVKFDNNDQQGKKE